jgi:nucleotide-binding universal stress UspA family protein
MKTEASEIFNGDQSILAAVDNSENAERAIHYISDLIGKVPGFEVTILTVVPEPPADYFEKEAERTSWIEERRSEATTMLDRYRKILVRSGIAEDRVKTIIDIKECPSVADCIMERQRQLKCRTVVIGRRGISKKEEFLFGSTSSKIIHSCQKNCAVWVIE